MIWDAATTVGTGFKDAALAALADLVDSRAYVVFDMCLVILEIGSGCVV